MSQKKGEISATEKSSNGKGLDAIQTANQAEGAAEGVSTVKLDSKESYFATVGALMETIKCKVFAVCEKAEIQKDAREQLAEELEKAKKSIELAPIREKKLHIGSNSITRYLLFGTNDDVTRTYGTQSSAKDRQLWMHIQERNIGNHPLYLTLKEKRGESIEIAETTDISFARNLDDLWKLKIKKWSSQEPDINQYYKARIVPLLKKSGEWKKTNLEDYSKRIQADIDEVVSLAGGYDGIQETLENKLGLSKKKAQQAVGVLKSIGADDLIALTMTEIMDKLNPEFNLRLLDFLLRNAGEEYVAHIPALHDKFVSMGGYQHTKFSVGGKIPKGTEAGAHQADRIFSKGQALKRSDGSKVTIETITPDEQHKAAYLLAMINIVGVVRGLGTADIQVEMPRNSKQGGKKKVPQFKTETIDLTDVLANCMSKQKKLCTSIFLQYTAASHNNPLAAREGLKEWLIDYRKMGAKVGDRLAEYIEKATAKQNAEKQRRNKIGIQSSEILLASAKK